MIAYNVAYLPTATKQAWVSVYFYKSFVMLEEHEVHTVSQRHQKKLKQFGWNTGVLKPQVTGLPHVSLEFVWSSLDYQMVSGLEHSLKESKCLRNASAITKTDMDKITMF